MKERNEGIERDVQRYKERKKIEHTVCIYFATAIVCSLTGCIFPDRDAQHPHPRATVQGDPRQVYGAQAQAAYLARQGVTSKG